MAEGLELKGLQVLFQPILCSYDICALIEFCRKNTCKHKEKKIYKHSNVTIKLELLNIWIRVLPLLFFTVQTL